MPTERPIIPKGMPNPIGPAVFEGTKNARRIGGELPVYKYPLVSKAPKQFSQKAKLVSTNQVTISLIYELRILKRLIVYQLIFYYFD